MIQSHPFQRCFSSNWIQILEQKGYRNVLHRKENLAVKNYIKIATKELESNHLFIRWWKINITMVEKGGGNPSRGGYPPPWGVISPPFSHCKIRQGGGYPYPLIFFLKKMPNLFFVPSEHIEKNRIQSQSHFIKWWTCIKEKKNRFSCSKSGNSEHKKRQNWRKIRKIIFTKKSLEIFFLIHVCHFEYQSRI